MGPVPLLHACGRPRQDCILSVINFVCENAKWVSGSILEKITQDTANTTP